MKNKYIFLRHAETIKDPNKNSVDWDLVPEALAFVNDYINQGEFENVTKIISSTESKAIATAKPVLEYLNNKRKIENKNKIVLELNEDFVEVKREKKFLTDEEFLDQKKRELANLDNIENGVESDRAALLRFIKGIEDAEDKYENENILIVSHGTIMTLYFAYLQNEMEDIFARWEKIKFCALGKVEEGKVVKDVI
jgi:broad specificity phosphatase PhoE